MVAPSLFLHQAPLFVKPSLLPSLWKQNVESVKSYKLSYILHHDYPAACHLFYRDKTCSISCCGSAFAFFQVRALVGDVADIENFANHVLKPLCNSSLQYRVATLDSLKVLQALSQTTPNSTNPGQIRKNTDDSRERICGKIAISNPPPVNNGEVCLRGRSFLPSCVRYPAIKPSLTQNPKGHHYMPRFLKPIRPVGQAPQRPWVHEVRETIYDHHQQKMELNVYIDRYEQATSQLQKTFTLFSQRVLVPLRTFCKISNRRFVCCLPFYF